MTAGRAVAALLLLGLGGCAYYNGMYNANRLARAAVKAEREGRTFDASSLWGQVGVKADTVLARHGGSKWVDDALLLRGKAYQRLGDCPSALKPLREVVATSADPALVDEASFLLGRCYQVLGNTEEASGAFARLINSADPARRNEALFQHGRSLRLGGRYEEALDALARTDDPRARGERLAAYAGLGRLESAAPLLDSLLAAQDTTVPWDSVAALAAKADPWDASELVDRLVAMPGVTPDQRARWLVADGERLAEVNPAAAERRLVQAAAVGGAASLRNRAHLSLTRLRFTRASADSLPGLIADLADLVQAGGEVPFHASRLSRGATEVAAAVDTVDRGAPAPDLRLFLAAETARDTLGADGLAASLFRRVALEWPDAPYAPKALLALAAIDSAGADTLLARLRAGYPGSPYLAAALGLEAPGYAALEDSLRVFAFTVRAVPARAPGAPRPGRQPQPSGSRLPEN